MERAEEAVKGNEEETYQSRESSSIYVSSESSVSQQTYQLRGSSSIYISSESSVFQQADAIFSTYVEESEDLDDVFFPSDEELENTVFTDELSRSPDTAEADFKEQPKWRRHQDSMQYLAGRDLEAYYQKSHYYFGLKMKKVGQSMNELFFQIHEAIALIDWFRESGEANTPNDQENHKQLWLEWSKKQFCGNKHLESTQPEQIETCALADICHIIQFLKDLCCDLMTDLPSVPSDIQEQIQGIKTHIEDIHASFSGATAFQDLSRNVLSQIRERAAKAGECLDVLLEYLVQKGPFTKRTITLSSSESFLEEKEG